MLARHLFINDVLLEDKFYILSMFAFTLQGQAK